MDNTGLITFILFDRNVQNYVGRSVQDLIEANSQVTYDHFGYSFFYCDMIVFLCLLVIWSVFHLIKVTPQGNIPMDWIFLLESKCYLWLKLRMGT